MIIIITIVKEKTTILKLEKYARYNLSQLPNSILFTKRAVSETSYHVSFI